MHSSGRTDCSLFKDPIRSSQLEDTLRRWHGSFKPINQMENIKKLEYVDERVSYTKWMNSRFVSLGDPVIPGRPLAMANLFEWETKCM